MVALINALTYWSPSLQPGRPGIKQILESFEAPAAAKAQKIEACEIQVGKGLIVAESISPVGRGTAGLLLIKGTPLPPPLSGINVGTVVIGELAALPPGAGAGEKAVSSRGRNGHGYAGEDDTLSPGVGAGTGGDGIGGSCTGGGDGAGETFMESFCES
ncbi:unnamed protein product [Dovyalis caffra]|uniref:Uncharacterized protein n=1 Tax=Dovyalis caffra TaxID=77055 RepID=A0AAV1S8W4_9ROSI|nr:unnamed protein product [Dovyalis caffra]